MMLASVQKCSKLEPVGAQSGIGVETVPRKEFDRRMQAHRERGTPFARYGWGLPAHLAYLTSKMVAIGICVICVFRVQR
jgi:hypothetical protein